MKTLQLNSIDLDGIESTGVDEEDLYECYSRDKQYSNYIKKLHLTEDELDELWIELSLISPWVKRLNSLGCTSWKDLGSIELIDTFINEKSRLVEEYIQFQKNSYFMSRVSLNLTKVYYPRIMRGSKFNEKELMEFVDNFKIKVESEREGSLSIRKYYTYINRKYFLVRRITFLYNYNIMEMWLQPEQIHKNCINLDFKEPFEWEQLVV